MNTIQKKELYLRQKKRYFKLQETARAFKTAFLVFPFSMSIGLVLSLLVDGKKEYLQEYETWKGIMIFFVCGMVIALIIVCWTYLEKVDLMKIRQRLYDNLSTNEEKINTLKERIKDRANHRHTIKLLSKIKRLEMKNEKIQFDLDVIKIKKN